MFAPSLSFYTTGIIIINITTIAYMLYRAYPISDILIIAFLYFLGLILTNIRGLSIGMLMATRNHKLRNYIREK